MSPSQSAVDSSHSSAEGEGTSSDDVRDCQIFWEVCRSADCLLLVELLSLCLTRQPFAHSILCGMFGICVFAAQAFPAQNPVDRTTYMFTYLDANERRPSLAALMELYWQTMPAYQVLMAVA